jgi:hypothetical protein
MEKNMKRAMAVVKMFPKGIFYVVNVRPWDIDLQADKDNLPESLILKNKFSLEGELGDSTYKKYERDNITIILT